MFGIFFSNNDKTKSRRLQSNSSTFDCLSSSILANSSSRLVRSTILRSTLIRSCFHASPRLAIEALVLAVGPVIILANQDGLNEPFTYNLEPVQGHMCVQKICNSTKLQNKTG